MERLRVIDRDEAFSETQKLWESFRWWEGPYDLRGACGNRLHTYDPASKVERIPIVEGLGWQLVPSNLHFIELPCAADPSSDRGAFQRFLANGRLLRFLELVLKGCFTVHNELPVPNDATCPVCGDAPAKPVAVGCGNDHVYCMACAAAWYLRSDTCAMCRAPVDGRGRIVVRENAHADRLRADPDGYRARLAEAAALLPPFVPAAYRAHFEDPAWLVIDARRLGIKTNSC
eukprot:tig00020553_g10526.t1